MEGRPGYVYLMGSENEMWPWIKIGRTTRPPTRRLEEIRPKLPIRMKITHLIVADDVHKAEEKMHEDYYHKRRGGEWFELSKRDIEKIQGLHVFLNGYFISFWELWRWYGLAPYQWGVKYGWIGGFPRLWLPAIPNLDFSTYWDDQGIYDFEQAMTSRLEWYMGLRKELGKCLVLKY